MPFKLFFIYLFFFIIPFCLLFYKLKIIVNTFSELLEPFAKICQPLRDKRASHKNPSDVRWWSVKQIDHGTMFKCTYAHWPVLIPMLVLCGRFLSLFQMLNSFDAFYEVSDNQQQ